eukprot:6173712-Pleurochrysis_carterae.AAC.2
MVMTPARPACATISASRSADFGSALRTCAREEKKRTARGVRPSPQHTERNCAVPREVSGWYWLTGGTSKDDQNQLPCQQHGNATRRFKAFLPSLVESEGIRACGAARTSRARRVHIVRARRARIACARPEHTHRTTARLHSACALEGPPRGGGGPCDE